MNRILDGTYSDGPTLLAKNYTMNDSSISEAICNSGNFGYSCFDEDLNHTGVTSVRWVSSTPNTATATASILLLYFIIGLPCNLFIILTILWKKLYHEPVHILLLNLALNDLLLCVTYIPINIISGFAGEFIFGGDDVTRCRVCQTGVIFIIFIQMNLHLVALMSLDRFLFFQCPFRYPRLVTVKSTTAAVLVTWLFCILISIPPLFKFGEIRFTHSISTCTIYLLDRTELTYNIFFEVFSIMESLVLPITVLVVSNVGVLRIVCKHISKMYGNGPEDAQRNECGENAEKGESNSRSRLKSKKQLRLVKVYGAILISNLVTWAPDVVNVSFIFAFCKRPFVIPHGLFVSNYVFFVSSVIIHPLLQACLIPDIRNIFTKYGRRSQDGQCNVDTRLNLHSLSATTNSRLTLFRSTSRVVSERRGVEGGMESMCCPCIHRCSNKVIQQSPTIKNPLVLANGVLAPSPVPSLYSLSSPPLSSSSPLPLLQPSSSPLPFLSSSPSLQPSSCIRQEQEEPV